MSEARADDVTDEVLRRFERGQRTGKIAREMGLSRIEVMHALASREISATGYDVADLLQDVETLRRREGPSKHSTQNRGDDT